MKTRLEEVEEILEKIDNILYKECSLIVKDLLKEKVRYEIEKYKLSL